MVYQNPRNCEGFLRRMKISLTLNFAQSCADSPMAKSCTAVASSRCRLCRHRHRRGCEVTETPTSQKLSACYEFDFLRQFLSGVPLPTYVEPIGWDSFIKRNIKTLIKTKLLYFYLTFTPDFWYTRLLASLLPQKLYGGLFTFAEYGERGA